MAKFAVHEQGSGDALTPSASLLGVEVELEPGTGGSSVGLVRPGSTTAVPREVGSTFSLEREFSTEVAMNAAFPDGAYSIVVDGGNPTVNFTFDAPPAEPLRVINLDELQNVPGADVTVRWTAPSAPADTDLLLLTFERESDGEELASATLQPTVSFWQVSGLPRETALVGNLVYAKLNLSLSNRVVIATTRGTVTRFPVRIAARDTTAPRVIDVSPGIGGQAPPAGPVVITFSKPMRTNYDGASPLQSVEGRRPIVAWSSDARQMLVTFDPPLPAGYYSLRMFDRLADQQNNRIEEDTFVVQFVVGSPPPYFVFLGSGAPACVGGTAMLYARVLGNGVTYQWQRDGVPIPGATGSAFVLHDIKPLDFGSRFQLVAANAAGRVTSNDAWLRQSPAATPARLVNLSIRANAGSGDATLVVGFATGAAPAGTSGELLLRAIGPGLATFGVTGTLPNPRLTLYSGQTVLVSNDDWNGDSAVAATAARVGAFSLPASSRDAALVQRLGGGSFTVQIADPQSTGMALAEIYDAAVDRVGAPRLLNVSARATVRPGDPLVAGLVVTGETDTVRMVMIRGAGPALRAFGISEALTDPRLIVRNQSGLVASNNFWSDFTSLGDAAEAARIVGAFPFNPASRDAAIVAGLSPGAYTVEVSSVDGTAGIALVEIYELP